MYLQGTVSTSQRGLHDSISAMHLQMELMGIGNANVQGFDKVGYQRKDPVVSSFAELIGIHALSEAVDEQVGRIVETAQPLDLAISNKGYFQILNKDGSIELTRDGRFKLNEKGELLGLEDQKVLTQGGSPIVLPFVCFKSLCNAAEPDASPIVQKQISAFAESWPEVTKPFKGSVIEIHIQ